MKRTNFWKALLASGMGLGMLVIQSDKGVGVMKSGYSSWYQSFPLEYHNTD